MIKNFVTAKFDIEAYEDRPACCVWYAVMKDAEDSDCGTGSKDFAEAAKMLRSMSDVYPNAFLAEMVLNDEDGTEEFIGEIHPDELDDCIERAKTLGIMQ